MSLDSHSFRSWSAWPMGWGVRSWSLTTSGESHASGSLIKTIPTDQSISVKFYFHASPNTHTPIPGAIWPSPFSSLYIYALPFIWDCKVGLRKRYSIEFPAIVTLFVRNKRHTTPYNVSTCAFRVGLRNLPHTPTANSQQVSRNRCSLGRSVYVSPLLLPTPSNRRCCIALPYILPGCECYRHSFRKAYGNLLLLVTFPCLSSFMAFHF